MLKPCQTAPELIVETIGSGTWRLSDQAPSNFTLIVFYRGVHCPFCRTQLQELKAKQGDFRARGVEVIAISGNSYGQAQQAEREWELEGLTVGYGQSVESMREWGLYISRGIKADQPELFSEPGLFLIRPDRTLYYVAVQSMPFARPSLQDLLSGIDFVLKNDYPARGEA
jgi:peroxiredoxin